MKYLKKIIFTIIRLWNKIFSWIIPVNNHYILFISFHGKGYSDNPKAIYEYIKKNEKYKKFKCIWVACERDKIQKYIPDDKVIKYKSLIYMYYLARCKYWVSNCKLPEYVIKKNSQIYLQTWHGTPLKRLAHDIQASEGAKFYRTGLSLEEMRSTYDNDVSKYTYMVSPNKFTTDTFQSAFKIERERLIETGYPRNDFLSNYTEKDVCDIKRKYGIPDGKKVVLYAPTWRDDSYDLKGYTFKLNVDFHKWKTMLGNEYIILFKPHYLIVNGFDISDLKDFIIQIPPKSDIAELYVISDTLITDYSSVFFDYAILKRPIYFYMYDLENYRDNLRGFYLDIYRELPGKIMQTEEALLEELITGVYDFDKLYVFNQRFNNCEDGKAAKRVTEILLD